MSGLSPLECFLVGAAFASTAAAVFLFFVLRSIVKQRQRPPVVPVKVGPGADLSEQGVTALHQRLQHVEKRLSELEREMRYQAMTSTGAATLAVADQVRE